MSMRFLVPTLCLAMAVGGSVAAAEPTPAELVDALNGVFGKHAGQRAAHPKGICAQGSFTANGEGAALSKAATLAAGAQAKAMVRFSIAGGDPEVADRGGVRGLAIHLELADGTGHDFVTISAPAFLTPTPELFVGFLTSRRPDPATGKPDPAAVAAFDTAHPEIIARALAGSKAPDTASYATTRYYAIHTFLLTGTDGVERPARFEWEPVAGVVTLSDAERLERGDNYLFEELVRRAAQAPVAFDLAIRLPQPGDPLDDPTKPWPDTRERRVVGRLVVESVSPKPGEGDCVPAMFDPLALPDGIAPSSDPVLLVRTGAYAESLTRRLSP